ncbi:hypothetical protein A7A09_018610, partial [Paracoccus methylarcula]
ELVDSVGETLESVTDLAGDLLGEGGVVLELVDNVGETLETITDPVVETASTVLTGVTDAVLGDDGVVDGVVETVGDTVETVSDTVVDIADGLLGQGGLLGGLTSTLGALAGGPSDDDANEAPVDAVETASTALTGAAETVADNLQTDVMTEAGSSEGPDIFAAIGQTLEAGEGLLGGLLPNITFIGQPETNDDSGPHADDANGSLLHGLI